MDLKAILPLLDVSTSHKLILTKELVEKIGYVCAELPTLEWSGILFYKVKGSFEDKNLVLTAVDMLVQDIGSDIATEFTPSPDIAYYMAQHDLLDCQMGLIHSHNKMSTFFSGTDRNTLSQEGADRNHFLSLIVNNAGSYTAKITRKIHYVEKTVLSYDYNTFEEGKVQKNNLAVDRDQDVIEVFPLIIEKEKSEKFKELAETLKELRTKKTPITVPAYGPNYWGEPWEKFYGSKTQREVYAGPANVAQQTIPFPQQKTAYGGPISTEMSKTGTKYPNKIEDGDEVYLLDGEDKPVANLDPSRWGENIPYGKVRYDTLKVQELIKRLLVGSPLLKTDIDIKEFVKGMDALYNKSFDSMMAFDDWAGSYIEFLIFQTEDESFVGLGCSIEEEQAILAHDVVEELNKLPENKWLTRYKHILSAYIL